MEAECRMTLSLSIGVSITVELVGICERGCIDAYRIDACRTESQCKSHRQTAGIGSCSLFTP